MALSIGIVVERYPALTETFIVREARYLKRAGLDATVFSLFPPGPRPPGPPFQDAPEAVPLHGRQARAGPASALRAVRAAASGLRIARPLRAFRVALLAARLARAARERGIGHLHAGFLSLPAQVAAAAARLLGVEASGSGHARDLFVEGARAPLAVLRSLAWIRVCSRAARDHLEGMGLPARFVPHGVDADFFSPGPRGGAAGGAGEGGAPRILAAGRFVEKKGFDVFLRAAAILQGRSVPFEAVIAGSGPGAAELSAAIERLGLSPRVLLGSPREIAARLLPAAAPPASDWEALRTLYRAGDLFAAPGVVAADGDRDGIPNTLLEAMACGLPAVGARAGGIGEAVEEGATGLLVPPGDAEPLADALERLVHDGPLRERMGAAARARVLERFDEKKVLTEVRALFDPGPPTADRRPPTEKARIRESGR